jgi:hypothetical protein
MRQPDYVSTGYSPTVENIIYGSCVKMDRMRKITYETFGGTSIANATSLNIYVDLYSVLKQIFSEHYRTVINNYTDITSGLINLCSHYRTFFKGLGVQTKFYLIMSYNTCDINEKFILGYNSQFKAKSEIKMFREICENNFELLELICPYLPGIYFVKSSRNYETSIMIANIIETLNDGNPNLILSKDPYNFQLLSIYPYTSLLFPLKYHGEDNSVMIPLSEKGSFRYEFWRLISHVRKVKLDLFKIDNQFISPINYPLYISLTKCPERCIKSLFETHSSIKKIYSLVGYEDIKVPISLIYDNAELFNFKQTIIESRLNAIDTCMILQYYKNDPESKSIKFEDLNDPSAINMINSKFFENNPIDLQKL